MRKAFSRGGFTMAVPKRKVSKARRDKRRSNNSKLTMPGLVKCSNPACTEIMILLNDSTDGTLLPDSQREIAAEENPVRSASSLIE